MILRPVRPQSPTGPPITKLPVGLMCNLVFGSLSSQFFGSTGLRMCSYTPSTQVLLLDARVVLRRQHDGVEAERSCRLRSAA